MYASLMYAFREIHLSTMSLCYYYYTFSIISYYYDNDSNIILIRKKREYRELLQHHRCIHWILGFFGSVWGWDRPYSGNGLCMGKRCDSHAGLSCSRLSLCPMHWPLLPHQGMRRNQECWGWLDDHDGLENGRDQQPPERGR